MIYDGRRGYLRGNLDEPDGTVLAMTVGPIEGRNWHNTTVDPVYSITITAGASGKLSLQGTNDVAYRSNTDDRVTVSANILPADDATWADIVDGTDSSVDGTISTSYEFLRVIVKTSGTGICTQAWVRWS